MLLLAAIALAVLMLAGCALAWALCVMTARADSEDAEVGYLYVANWSPRIDVKRRPTASSHATRACCSPSRAHSRSAS